MSNSSNYPLNVNSLDRMAIKVKKNWIMPDFEIIDEDDIKSGSIPHSFEDVFPLKTFQHS